MTESELVKALKQILVQEEMRIEVEQGRGGLVNISVKIIAQEAIDKYYAELRK